MDKSKMITAGATEVADAKERKYHGRVKFLEPMVPSDWWVDVFADSMYLRTDGDVVEDPHITESEIGLLENMPQLEELFSRGKNLDKENPVKIMDLCCGQGRHSLRLADKYQNFVVHGHDRSSYLINLATERASTQKVSERSFFTVGDCRQIPYDNNTFDLVLMIGNSFGYLPNDDENRAILDEVQRVLSPGGYFILDITDGQYMKNHFEERSWEFMDDNTFCCRQRQLSKDGLRLVSREIITDAFKGVICDQFYQERLYSKNDLYEIISKAGLSVAGTLGVTTANISTLGQLQDHDLGMMGHRIMFIAYKPVPDLSKSFELNGSTSDTFNSGTNHY